MYIFSMQFHIILTLKKMVISLAVSFYKTEYHPDPTIITNSDKKKCMIKDRTINT